MNCQKKNLPLRIKNKVDKEHLKVQDNLELANQPTELIDCKKFSSWRRLFRVTSCVMQFISNLEIKLKIKNQARSTENNATTNDGPLTLQELQDSEIYWIKESQKSLLGRLKKGDFQK